MTTPTFTKPMSRLREASWIEVARAGYFIIIGGMLVGLLAGGDLRREILMPVSLALALALLVAKDLSGAPEACRRWRSSRRDGAGPVAQIAAFLPPPLVGLMRVERQMWRGFFAWLRRQPNVAPRPEGTRIEFLGQGAYLTVVAIALVSLLVELPIHSMILPIAVNDPVLVARLQVLLGVGSLYSLVWVMGDRWHVKASYHVLTGDALDLRIGVRAQASIPLACIERCERLRETRSQWCRQHGVRMADTIVISPIDRPNLVLVLVPEAMVPVSLVGDERLAPRYVFVYVDRPDLIADLSG